MSSAIEAEKLSSRLSSDLAAARLMISSGPKLGLGLGLGLG